MASFHLIQNSINSQVRNYKVPGNIKHLINFRKVPKINFETEVKETIGRGSGPGGTNVNKANNAVRLVHLETKIQVKNHESRSVEKNREFARYIRLESFYTAKILACFICFSQKFFVWRVQKFLY